jgi:menaquinone-dependent protoporphyrinogen oxidase
MGREGEDREKNTMNGKQPSSKRISRRGFLKAGCLGAAAAGVTACGGAGLAIALTPDPPPVQLRSFEFGDSSMKKVLIVYASATGSTVEVAEAIGKTLGERGFSVDVRPVKEKPAVDGYQAVIIGSAVQGSKWLPEAAEFVQTHQAALKKIPMVLMSVHFFFRGEGENDRKMRLAYLDPIRPLVPHATEVFFAGRFDRRTTAVGVPEWLARLTPTIDRRDWGKIRAWAETVFL